MSKEQGKEGTREGGKDRSGSRPSAKYLRGQRIDPKATTGKETVAELIDNAFLAYNAGRLREGCQLFTERMLAPDVTVGMTLTGAMTPAGLGMSCLIPLMESGFVDWIISTGANLYHDAHFALGLAMHRGTPGADDVELRDKGVVRIYDIFFDYNVLLSTDAFVREVSAREEFQRPMSSAEYHYLLGGYVRERERALGLSAPFGALGRPRVRGADLHQLPGRQLDRHERGGAGAGRQQAQVRCECRCE